MIGIPSGSQIHHIQLNGGGSHQSAFAPARGGVLKFHRDHADQPVVVNGCLTVTIDGETAEVFLTVPTGYVLMDEASFHVTQRFRSPGVVIPHRIIDIPSVCREPLYLIHASFSHPDRLFVPRDSFTEATFIPASGRVDMEGFQRDGTLYCLEADLVLSRTPLFEPATFEQDRKGRTVLLQLNEGGFVFFRDRGPRAVPNPWRGRGERQYSVDDAMIRQSGLMRPSRLVPEAMIPTFEPYPSLGYETPIRMI